MPVSLGTASVALSEEPVCGLAYTPTVSLPTLRSLRTTRDQHVSGGILLTVAWPALHGRLAQIMGDAARHGRLPRSPRTSPGQIRQRPYVATTEQVWTLHGVMPKAPERAARGKVDGLPEGFRVSRSAALLRLVADRVRRRREDRPGRLRHAAAKTTLDAYGHPWPDRDEPTRAAVEAVFQDRAGSPRTAAGLR